MLFFEIYKIRSCEWFCISFQNKFSVFFVCWEAQIWMQYFKMSFNIACTWTDFFFSNYTYVLSFYCFQSRHIYQIILFDIVRNLYRLFLFFNRRHNMGLRLKYLNLEYNNCRRNVLLMYFIYIHMYIKKLNNKSIIMKLNY